jgi:hypothetical protein
MYIVSVAIAVAIGLTTLVVVLHWATVAFIRVDFRAYAHCRANHRRNTLGQGLVMGIGRTRRTYISADHVLTIRHGLRSAYTWSTLGLHLVYIWFTY